MKNLKWATVFFALIVVCAAVIALNHSLPREAKTAKILQNGEVIREVSLQDDTPREFKITASDGGYNTVRVENGKIGIVSATCPDKICVRQGFISTGALPIVCLPNKLSVVITEKDDEIDAVSGGL